MLPRTGALIPIPTDFLMYDLFLFSLLWMNVMELQGSQIGGFLLQYALWTLRATLIYFYYNLRVMAWVMRLLVFIRLCGVRAMKLSTPWGLYCNNL